MNVLSSLWKYFSCIWHLKGLTVSKFKKSWNQLFWSGIRVYVIMWIEIKLLLIKWHQIIVFARSEPALYVDIMSHT